MVPVAADVEDLHWLAYRVHSDTGSLRCAGIAGALAWVGGGQPGPVTGRTEKPVTEALARAEMWSAIAISDAGTPPPLESICADLGVEYWPAQPVEREWANGVWLALHWLLGEDGADPPMTLPVRGSDGAVLSADQLYEQALACAPLQYETPEQRRSLREQTRRLARESRQVAELIEDTKRRVPVAPA